MWWKKYSGYKKPLDKLKQWTEVNKMEFSKVKCEVLLPGLRKKNTHQPQVWERMGRRESGRAWLLGASCRADSGGAADRSAPAPRASGPQPSSRAHPGRSGLFP